MSELLTVDEDDVQELFFERGWTDGLPIVPPTPRRVEAMLAAAGLAAEDVLGTVVERSRSVSGEQAAICAVMAGCPPDCFPIVLAAIDALLDPAFNPHGVLSSTGGAATAVVVSGPIARQVGMNSGHSVLGPGNRPNATIGRALRLLAITVFDARPGEMDSSSIGHPGKYTLCFAEDEPPSPWEPLRMSLGFDRRDTTVTLMPVEGPRQIANHLNGDGRAVLRTIAAMMRNPATFIVGKGGQGIVVLGPEHMLALLESGISRAEAARVLVEESRIAPSVLHDAGVIMETRAQHEMAPGPDGLLPTVASPEDVLIVTAGGGGAGWSAWMPSYAPPRHGRHVTRRVRPVDEPLPDCGPDSCDISLPDIS